MISKPPPLLSLAYFAVVVLIGGPVAYICADPQPRTATQPAAGGGTDAELSRTAHAPQASILARLDALEADHAALADDVDALIRENREIRTMLGGYDPKPTKADPGDPGETPGDERRPPPTRRAAKPQPTEETAETRPPIARNDNERCTATAYSTGKRCKLRATDGNGRCKYHTDR